MAGEDAERAYAGLQRLMAERDAAAAGANQGWEGYLEFMAAEQRVAEFAGAHDAELAELREPAEGLTAEQFGERLAGMDAELDWLGEQAGAAGNEGPAQEAYSAAWADRMGFAANYDPEPDPEAEAG